MKWLWWSEFLASWGPVGVEQTARKLSIGVRVHWSLWVSSIAAKDHQYVAVGSINLLCFDRRNSSFVGVSAMKLTPRNCFNSRQYHLKVPMTKTCYWISSQWPRLVSTATLTSYLPPSNYLSSRPSAWPHFLLPDPIVGILLIARLLSSWYNGWTS